MKVRAFVEYVDVDVSLGDVLSALDDLPDSDRMPSILSAINTAHGILQRVASDHIAELDVKQREIIGSALLEEARRYLPTNAPTTTGN